MVVEEKRVNIISVQSVQHGGKVGNPLKWPPLLYYKSYESFLCLTFFLEIFQSPSKLSFVWFNCAAALRKSSLTFTTAISEALCCNSRSRAERRTASSAIMMTDRELLVIDMKRRNMQLDPFPYPQKYGLKLDSCVIK